MRFIKELKSLLESDRKGLKNHIHVYECNSELGHLDTYYEIDRNESIDFHYEKESNFEAPKQFSLRCEIKPKYINKAVEIHYSGLKSSYKAQLYPGIDGYVSQIDFLYLGIDESFCTENNSPFSVKKNRGYIIEVPENKRLGKIRFITQHKKKDIRLKVAEKDGQQTYIKDNEGFESKQEYLWGYGGYFNVLEPLQKMEQVFFRFTKPIFQTHDNAVPYRMVPNSLLVKSSINFPKEGKLNGDEICFADGGNYSRVSSDVERFINEGGLSVSLVGMENGEKYQYVSVNVYREPLDPKVLKVIFGVKG